MGSLPPVSRISREDVPGAPAWIDRLLLPINSFMDAVYSLANKNIALVDNVISQEESFVVTAGAAATNNTASFSLKMKKKPRHLIVTNVVNSNGSLAPVGAAVYADWYFDGTQIKITSITGLATGSKYTVTVLLFP